MILLLLFLLFNFFSCLEVTTVKIYFSHEDPYCFDEDVTIYAEFGNPLAVRDVTWLRETDTGSQDIDTTLPKFTSTKSMLIIKKCCQSDIGTYTLVARLNNVDIYSNKIQLNPVKGKQSSFIINDCFKTLLFFCSR